MEKERKGNQRKICKKNNNNTNENNGFRRISNFICFSYVRIGHYAAQCKEKGAKAEQKDDRTHHIFSISNTCKLRKVWCADSGTSAYLCCDRNTLDQSEEHEEEIIIAGSNRIQTEGKE